MEIKSAEYKLSIHSLKEAPKGHFPEYAFIGRSNVGKSSLINMLTGKKELARTSSTPGKTISMNYFLINNGWYIVDLPGYGYAKRSKTLRSAWEKELEYYLSKRETLICLFVLIDSRIPPQTNDLSFIGMLGQHRVPFAIVFTKTDKLKPGAAEANIQAFCDELLKDWQALPEIFKTSSLEKTGREEMLAYIESLNKTYHKELTRP